MTTIYIVTSGEYSDYSIESVFDDKALADAYIAIRGKGAQIEEYELNLGEEQIRAGFAYYRVYIYRNGNANAGFTGFETKDETDKPKYFLSRVYPPIGDRKAEEMVMPLTVSAKNEQHACKIANEKRAQLIASGEWDRLEEELRVNKK